MKLFRFFTILILVLNFNFPIKVQAYNNAPLSTWLWNTGDIVQNSDKILKFSSTKGVKVIYLQVNYDISTNAYKTFISKASSQNISVQALNGSPNWIFPNGQATQKRFFDWLTNYQNSARESEKFKGVHLDVEPYVNTLYEKSPNIVIEGYQSFLLSSINRSNLLKLPMNIDIPFWFDEVKYSNKYGSGILVDWILRNVKQVTIMAYRNTSTGNNGIIKLISNEMNLAKKYNAKITVAVETHKSSEGSHISFYGMGQTKMQQQLDMVYNYYRSYSSFSGFAVHDINNWMLLGK
ncbi:MAG: hypothetical protein AB6733_18375 [Clostridiaceae bacterium]